MPTVFRSMIRDGNAPVIGQGDNMLGVRVPPHPRADVTPADDDSVGPGDGGMSVNRDWRKMPFMLIPRSFNRILLKARGSLEKGLWRFGQGEFVENSVAEGLTLRVDSSNHGLVEAAERVAVERLQENLAKTRDGWQELKPEDAA